MANRTLFFDIGNVLLFFSYKKMLLEMERVTKLSSEKLYRILFEEKLEELYELGKIDSKAFYETIQKHSAASFSKEDLMHAASNMFSPNLEMWDLVEELKKSDHQLILLSNTNECHFEKIEKEFPIIHLFDEKVLSFQIKAMKPEAKIFEEALLRANVPKERCFYTDDLKENIDAAKRMGIDSHLFTECSDLKKALIDRNILN